MSNEERNALGDEFDRMVRSLEGLPDVIKTAPSTVSVLTPVLNLAQTFIVQTYRHSEKGDIVFVQYVSANGSMRIVLPPAVANTIARQRDALTTKNRKKGARQAVQTRKERGIEPNFTKKKVRS
jgi:hypothetical protein